jgi:hypothetical protein
MASGKNFFPLATLVVVASVASAGLTRLTMGGDPPAKEAATTAWEYEVWSASEALQAQKLKTAGAEGWELVTATAVSTESSPSVIVTLYFKRAVKR